MNRFKTITLLLFLLPILSLGQQDSIAVVKFQLDFEKNEPIRGGTLYIVNSNPPRGTNSNMSGYAKLQIGARDSSIRLNFMGPDIEFKLLRPVDSIYVNLKRKKVVYYYESKKVRRRRLKIDY